MRKKTEAEPFCDFVHFDGECVKARSAESYNARTCLKEKGKTFVGQLVIFFVRLILNGNCSKWALFLQNDRMELIDIADMQSQTKQKMKQSKLYDIFPFIY